MDAKLNWGMISSKHHGKRAIVSHENVHSLDPEYETYEGTIDAPFDDALPKLIIKHADQYLVHTFAWYWEVDILD